MCSKGCTAVLELLATPARAIIIAADPGRRARSRGLPGGAAQEKIDVREIFGLVRFYTDRKSTRLNSSHLGISYAVFCLKKDNVQRGFAIVIVVFFNDTATTEIYTLSLHDALPISAQEKIDVREIFGLVRFY